MSKRTVSVSYPPLPSFVIDKLQRCVATSPTITSLKTDSLIVFVCGAQSSIKQPTGRDIFMTYAGKHLRQYKFVMAEHVFSLLKEKSGKNLLELEGELARFADCIIIILESPGANAELGAFTFDPALAEIVMVINSIDYRGTESFITDGPIAHVDKVSKFRPVIYANFASILSVADQITERLSTLRTRAETVTLSNYIEFSARDYKSRMLFLADLIAVFCPLTHNELISILKQFYGDNSYRINMELAVLIEIGLIYKSGEYYLRSLEDKGLFYNYGKLDEAVLRSQVINYYHKRAWNRTALLQSRAGV